jgi:hypothetical protein
MVDFGWSASCILEAIKIANKIRKALQDAGGAKDQYIEAVSFLIQSENVFQELEMHIRQDAASSLSDRIVQQLKLMEPPWTRLQAELDKYESSLGHSADSSKARLLVRKVEWALSQLDEAVRTARSDIAGPLQMVNCLLQLRFM